MKRILPLLILSAIFSFNSSYAQQKVVFNVKGNVVDTVANSPVQFSTLTIVTKANPARQVKVLATDDKGNFQVGLNSAGEYILSIFYFGNKAADVPFTIEEGKKTTDLGVIGVADVSQLDEVVVIAQKPLVTVGLDKLTYDTESDPDSKTETALEMLRKVPMVSVDSDDNIQLRGSTNFKVYVNGKPSTMITNNPSEVLRSMPANNIKNIEVITNPGAKYDAEGIGGIINITMVKSGDNGYTATVSANVNTLGGYGGSAFLTLKQGKFGFSSRYGYNYWKGGTNDVSMLQENFTNNTILSQLGTSTNKGTDQWGSAELSYEFDTLNMVTISVDHYFGSGKNNGTTAVEQLLNNNPDYSYSRYTKSKSNYGGTEINANYQRSFKKKGMLLTASYRYDFSPNDSEYETELINPINYDPLWERSENDASSNEHTFQLDYVNPIKDKHNIEVGAKYIIRLNDSDPLFEQYNYLTNVWERNTSRENTMDYTQNIFSGYASYSYRLNKISFNAGIRLENTDTDINFKAARDITNNTTDIVPSAAISYQLGMTKNLRFNYNMRIRRPSIWYLNPYEDRSDPTNIRYGNPNLDSEDSHNFSISFGSFAQKVNFNASLNYTISDNAIQEYSLMQADTLRTTYGNIGKNKSIGLNLYGNWTPIKDLRLMVNGNISYVDIKTKSIFGAYNYGFGGNVFFNASYTFLKSFRASVFAGHFRPPVTMQTEMSSFTFIGLGLGKEFFDKKLSININVQDPFTKRREFTSKTYGKEFYQEMKFNTQHQTINFRVSYRFGNLKNQQIKKVQRGISNDDLMQGSGGNTGGENTPTAN
ncbi:MAG: TonB-dependent receptor [Prevotellaceae bacterium]|jgi:outer membrane receptor protein involved in Fe transport|nr:TonB-dependent receptor [Prevotellaceae bacterium]